MGGSLQIPSDSSIKGLELATKLVPCLDVATFNLLIGEAYKVFMFLFRRNPSAQIYVDADKALHSGHKLEQGERPSSVFYSISSTPAWISKYGCGDRRGQAPRDRKLAMTAKTTELLYMPGCLYLWIVLPFTLFSLRLRSSQLLLSSPWSLLSPQTLPLLSSPSSSLRPLISHQRISSAFFSLQHHSSFPQGCFLWQIWSYVSMLHKKATH